MERVSSMLLSVGVLNMSVLNLFLHILLVDALQQRWR